MIIKPKIYASALIEALEEKKDTKQIAKNFWRLLQKDKQYKNLNNILDSLEKEYAERKNLRLIKVYSDEPLSQDREKLIKEKLTAKFGKNIVTENIIKANITGVIVETEDEIIDLSLTGKIQRLKNHINN